jgi:peptidoglycan hydrolase-like protein with peptidoglycan-binding domain
MRHPGKRRPLCAQLRVCFISCCLILAGAVEVSAAAAAGSSTSTATAPQQLVHEYPLGPKRLCCKSGSRPAAGSPGRKSRSAGQPAGGTGFSFVILLGALGALLVLTVLSTTYRMRRRSAAPAPADGIDRVNEALQAPVDDVAGPPPRVARRATIPEPSATDRIERVKALQGQLSRLGFEPGQVDGRYGPLTTGAVERFQETRGLPVDGVVGPLTAGALRATVPEPPATDRIERVKALQSQLSWLGFEPGQVDGRYGPLTTGAVRSFQEACGLPVDGVVGPLTADALRASTRQRPTMDRIERVKALQRQLTALGFEPGPVDGRYGPHTTEAVKRFQQAYDLRVDGVVDPLTRRALEHHALF